ARHGKGTEGRVLVADLARFLVLRRIAPGLDLLHAVPLDHRDAALRRRAFDHSDVGTRGQDLAAGLPDRGLRLRRILLGVGIDILDVDLADVEHGRLGLRVQLIDGDGAEAEAGDGRGQYGVSSFHDVSPCGRPATGELLAGRPGTIGFAPVTVNALG